MGAEIPPCLLAFWLDRLLACWYVGGVKALTVRVEDDLLLRTKRRALDTGVSLQEVVSRLLTAYVDGRVGVLTEGGSPDAASQLSAARLETERGGPDSAVTLPPSVSAKPSMDELLEAGRKNRDRPPNVDEDGVIHDFSEPFEEAP